MKEKGYTQEYIANKLNISRVAFNNSLSRGDLKVSRLVQLADILDTPISYFFDEDNPSSNVTISNGSGNVAVGNSKIIIKEQKKEIEHLRREVELLRELLQQKDEMIRMLKKMKG